MDIMSRVSTRNTRSALRISVRVKPRARSSAVLGMRQGALEVSVAAPPVDGAANQELIRVLARHFGLPRSAVSIVSGTSGRSKLVALAGLDETLLHDKLCGGESLVGRPRRR